MLSDLKKRKEEKEKTEENTFSSLFKCIVKIIDRYLNKKKKKSGKEIFNTHTRMKFAGFTGCEFHPLPRA